MYAIVKTGGKQYKVAPGDVISIEKLNAEVGDEVELTAICIVDGDAIEADPAKAAETKVVAEVIDQYKGKKQLVFKFKKRKGYKKLNGHRQRLTKVRVISVGAEAVEKTEFAEVEEIEEVEFDVEEIAARIGIRAIGVSHDVGRLEFDCQRFFRFFLERSDPVNVETVFRIRFEI